MSIRSRAVVYRASLFAGVFTLMAHCPSTQAAAGFMQVDAHYDAVVERHREERLRDERVSEEHQQDARRQQAIRDDNRRRADHAQREHASSEHEQTD